MKSEPHKRSPSGEHPPFAPARRLGTALVFVVLVTLAAALAFRAIGTSTDPSNQSSQLYSIEVDGRGLSPLTADERHRYWGPAWSPDGRLVAYTVIPPDGPGQLYVADADGANGRQITHDERGGYLPSWSPDSKRLAFVGQLGTDPTTARIYIANADGTQKARLTSEEGWEYGASWSPDGTQIVYGAKRGGTWGLYIANADGSNPRALVGAGDGNAPAWSPDGKQIVFKSGLSGHDRIYMVGVAGDGLRQLAGDDRSHASNPVWSPDGARIAFSWDRDGKSNLYVMDADGTNPTDLTRDIPLSIQTPTWSADGRRIAFHARDAGPAASWTPRVLRSLVVVLHAAIFSIVLLFLVRRWRLPVGALTLFGLLGGAILGALLDQYALAAATLLGGMLSDALLALLQPSLHQGRTVRLAALLLPIALYGPPLIYLAFTQPEDFPPLLVGVTLVAASLSGLLAEQIVARSTWPRTVR